MELAKVLESFSQNYPHSNLENARQEVLHQSIKTLQDIPEFPNIPEAQRINYYVEPIEIEYYVAKKSRFSVITKYLFLELLDPVPTNPDQQRIYSYFRMQKEPIDILRLMDIFPVYMKSILLDYLPELDLFESLSKMYRAMDEEPLAIRQTLYMNEVLRKKEPTISSLKILGDFTLFNINWAVRFLNQQKIPHTLEDSTVAYYIDINKNKMLQTQNIDDRFLILSDIYLHQAFPHLLDDD